jgi:hypothetical protein
MSDDRVLNDPLYIVFIVDGIPENIFKGKAFGLLVLVKIIT